jgi:hypothetical protein
MTEKEDIQAEIDSLQGDIDDLAAQRDVLQADKDNILAGLEGKALLVSEALLADSDASALSADLEADKVKLTDDDAALALAESRLVDYSDTFKKLQRALAHVDYVSLVDETNAFLIDCMSHFQDAIDAHQALASKLVELAQIVSAGEDGADEYSYRNLLIQWNIFFAETSVIVKNRLDTMERSYPTKLAAIRSKLG